MIKQILIQQCILNNRIGLSQACLGKMKKKKKYIISQIATRFYQFKLHLHILMQA